MEQKDLDMQGLNLGEKDEEGVVDEPPPKMSIAREKIIEEAKKSFGGRAEGWEEGCQSRRYW